MKRLVVFSVILLSITSTSAYAMGSGNRYEDAQVGLDYVVYEPINTAALKVTNFTMDNCHNNHDMELDVIYGSGKKFFTLREQSTKWICPINYMLIRGAVRTVQTRPGAGMLTGTSISIVSIGLSRSEIMAIFKAMIPKFRAN